MKAREIRRGFLEFFGSKGHRVVPSSSLVPVNDPTLLFVNAGMNQFKDLFLGLEKRDYRRATTVQKCVRAGGKHNDLENVGVTARHHTFFEMLGNFSFGEYFKKEAIDFAWEFLVDRLKLDPARLAVTIFEGDSAVPRDAEACEHWKRYVAPSRIHELGRKDNFWSMGDTGPCGPCSEVHFFQGDHLPCSAPSCLGLACECDRWLEIWNLVFMQFDRAEDGTLTPLPAPSVDTGMGLERITAVVQRVESNYDTDLFTGILKAIETRTGRKYGGGSSPEDVSFRVVADHVRATTFLIADGVMPQNEGRGYVLRKIMRRAMRHGKRLGVQEPFLFELVKTVVEEMQDAYPEIVLARELVERVVRSEEDRFRTTLTHGIAALEEMLASEEVERTKTLGGAAAFKLYDTFGMPLDLAIDIAAESAVRVDEAGFEREMETQRTRARESWKKSAGAPDRSIYGQIRGRTETRFEGYGRTQIPDARIVALVRGGAEVKELRAGDKGEVFLDVTPFYPEGGGQVGDQGILAGADGVATVLDTKTPVPGLVTHQVVVTQGSIGVDQRVRAVVDERSREGAAAHHTITHMLHAALRETLGPHVKQAGSLVGPGRLRFDFTHFAPLTRGEVEQIEGRVTEKILEDIEVRTAVLPIDEALKKGAIAFFGEKYGDRVRVVQVADFSLELCGGTHLARTGQAGLFVIVSESSIASGVRRIEALTGAAAVDYLRSQRALVAGATEVLHVRPEEIPGTIEKLREELKRKEREIESLKMKLAQGGAAGETAEATTTVGTVVVWTPPALVDFDKKQHRQFVDDFKEKHRDRSYVAVSTAVNDDKVSLIVEVSSDLVEQVRADHLVKGIAPVIEGRGGGKPERAEAGGRFPERIPELYQRAKEAVRLALEGQRV
jgi:alanyl-tRNA synthetase